MKKALATFAFGPVYERLAEVTHPNLKSYAHRIGADFIRFTSRRHSEEHVMFEKLQVRQLLQGSYERVIWMDTDVVIRSDAPDLTDIVRYGHYGVWDEAPSATLWSPEIQREYHNYQEILRETCKTLGLPPMKWDGKWYCMGVMVLDRTHLDVLQDPPAYPGGWVGEQNYLNTMLRVHGVPIHGLPAEFHMMFLSKKPRLDAYVVHYAGIARGGGWKAEIPEGSDLPGLVRRDLEIWKERGF
jgi:hypothetical protein